MKYFARFILGFVVTVSVMGLVVAMAKIWEIFPEVVYTMIGVTAGAILLFWAFVRAEI